MLKKKNRDIKNHINMAESKAKIEFQLNRKIFDLVGDEGLCTFCKITPRGPIYQSGEEGTIVCSTCKDSKKGKFQQNDMTKLVEKLLSTLPRSCKFKKNGCKRTMDIQSIEYHEEDCEHRDIQCVFGACGEILPASSLFDHLETVHKVSFHQEDLDYEKKGSKHIFKRFFHDLEENDFVNGATYTFGVLIQKTLIFGVHFDFSPEIRNAKCFVRILGSKFEAMNYKYAIKIEDPVFGVYYYQNQVKSLDDKREDVFESNVCLILPLEMFREYIGKDFKFVVEIEDLKPRDE